MGSETGISLFRSAKASVGFLARELLPRYRAPIAKPFKILAGYREYQERLILAKGLIAGTDAARLTQDGYSILDGEAVGALEVSRAGATRLAETQDMMQRGGKEFFSQLLTKEDRAISSPFMRFALDENILRSVAAYLGCAPYLEYVELLHSKPVGKISSSQLWHKDRTDRSLVKVFVYCLDVTPENGPFSFFSRDDSALVPEYLPHYLPDEVMARYVSLSNVISLTGKACTAVMIDTRHCYHFGSRCVKPRLAFVTYYSSGFGYYPRETKWGNEGSSLETLSPLQKMALGL